MVSRTLYSECENMSCSMPAVRFSLSSDVMCTEEALKLFSGQDSFGHPARHGGTDSMYGMPVDDSPRHVLACHQ
eukprot:scaffold131257_cov19-Prasinocladus_malaysianus.AAC.1